MTREQSATDARVVGGAAAARPAAHAARDAEMGGDPACWLSQVCDACGRMIEDPLADACPTCGAAR